MALLLVGTASAAEPTERFVTALRERGLDSLLEAYCRRELTSGVAGALAIELSHLLARRAARIPDAAQRDKTWKEAHDVLANAVKELSDPLGRCQLELHQAALLYAQGEWLRQWEALQGRMEQAPAAIEPLELALALTQSLLVRIEEQWERLAPASTNAPGRESSARWQELSQLANLRLGLIRTALARSLPTNDPERAEQFLLAIEDLHEIDNSTALDAGQATLALSDALRGLGRNEEALEVLGALKLMSVDPATANHVLAEQVEALLALGRNVEALAVLYPARASETSMPLSAESEYLYLKVLLRQANEMRDDPDAVGKLQSSALRQMRRLEELGDPLWIRQAEVLLRQHAQDLLLRDTSEYRQAADALARTGDFAEAATVYHRAAQQAQQQGNEPNAIDLFQAAARCWEQAAAYEKARDVLATIEKTWPDHPAAAEILLRAVINARRAYLDNAQKENYARLNQLANHHQERFPEDPTAGEILYLLGSLRYAEHRYKESLQAFRAIPKSHRLYRPGVLAASRAYQAWKQPLGQSSDEMESAVKFMENVYKEATADASANESDLNHWTVDERAEMGVRLARFLLDPRCRQYPKARELLESLLRLPDIPHDLRQEANALLILALVQDLQFTQAQKIAAEMPTPEESDLWYLVEILNRRAQDAGEIERRMIGRVQAVLLERMAGGKNSKPSEADLRSVLARLHAQLNLGEPELATEVSRKLELLHKSHPRDARVLELLAVSYQRQGKAPLAVPLWRELVEGLPQRSEGWFRAKLELVRSLIHAGNITQARETLQLFETLYPDLGGPNFEKQFRAEHDRLFDPASSDH